MVVQHQNRQSFSGIVRRSTANKWLSYRVEYSVHCIIGHKNVTYTRPLSPIGEGVSYQLVNQHTLCIYTVKLAFSLGRSPPNMVHYASSHVTVYVTAHQHQYEISFLDMAFAES